MLIKLRYSLNQDSHALCLKNNQPLSFTLCSLYNVWSWESISRMIFASYDSSPVWPKWTLWRRILLKLMKYSISSNLSLPNSGLHGKAPANEKMDLQGSWYSSTHDFCHFAVSVLQLVGVASYKLSAPATQTHASYAPALISRIT